MAAPLARGRGATGAAGRGGTTGAAGAAGTTGAAGRGGTTGSGGSVGPTGTGGATGMGGGPAGPAIAFPGAQGFGKKATGARNGVVYHVTNLNDAGAGSFRDAVSASNRFVVFDVGGYIQLVTAVSVKSNITIAGQTAPGGGIGFRGGEISFANSVEHHHAPRPHPPGQRDRQHRGRRAQPLQGEQRDDRSLVVRVRALEQHRRRQRRLAGQPDDGRDDSRTRVIADPTGQQFGAHTESVSSQMAWYRNIFANSHNRNPLAKVNTVFVNNLLYNDSAGYTTHTSTNFKHDILNNYFVFGPASTGTDNTWYQVDKNQAIYYAGNLKDTNRDGTLNGAATTPYWYQGEGTVLTSAVVGGDQRHPGARHAVRGARRDLAGRDAAARSDGRADHQPGDDAGQRNDRSRRRHGRPRRRPLHQPDADRSAEQRLRTIAGGTRPTDTDNDGMPDTWESANGSNVSTNDAMTKAADGYALIEHYVNWLAVPHATSAAGASVDVDLSAWATGFSAVSPTYTVSGAQSGTVTLQADGHTARFQPASGFHGVASFSFKVTGSDGTAYTNEVQVLAAP